MFNFYSPNDVHFEAVWCLNWGLVAFWISVTFRKRADAPLVVINVFL